MIYNMKLSLLIHQEELVLKKRLRAQVDLQVHQVLAVHQVLVDLQDQVVPQVVQVQVGQQVVLVVQVFLMNSILEHQVHRTSP